MVRGSATNSGKRLASAWCLWTLLRLADIQTLSRDFYRAVVFGPVDGMSWEMPDPPRDEDFPDDEVVFCLEHHCTVLTPDWWMCEDCGVSFPRNALWGDFPEECIIEGGTPCASFIPNETS